MPTTQTTAPRTSLAHATVQPTLSVTDIDRARTFYTETLGLPVISDNTEGFRLGAGGGTSLYVYARADPPKAENTAASFGVADVHATVAALRARGVVFEEYDIPGIKTVDGVAQSDAGFIGAWFKDPDGNILAITDDDANKS